MSLRPRHDPREPKYRPTSPRSAARRLRPLPSLPPREDHESAPGMDAFIRMPCWGNTGLSIDHHRIDISLRACDDDRREVFSSRPLRDPRVFPTRRAVLAESTARGLIPPTRPRSRLLRSPHRPRKARATWINVADVNDFGRSRSRQAETQLRGPRAVSVRCATRATRAGRGVSSSLAVAATSDPRSASMVRLDGGTPRRRPLRASPSARFPRSAESASSSRPMIQEQNGMLRTYSASPCRPRHRRLRRGGAAAPSTTRLSSRGDSP